MMPTTSAASATLKVSHSCVPIFQTTKSVTRPKNDAIDGVAERAADDEPELGGDRSGRRSSARFT